MEQIAERSIQVIKIICHAIFMPIMQWRMGEGGGQPGPLELQQFNKKAWQKGVFFGLWHVSDLGGKCEGLVDDDNMQ
jgi:hypothetical protein